MSTSIPVVLTETVLNEYSRALLGDRKAAYDYQKKLNRARQRFGLPPIRMDVTLPPSEWPPIPQPNEGDPPLSPCSSVTLDSSFWEDDDDEVA